MSIVFFPSHDEAEAIDVAFVDPQGGERILRLLVDSGFTGQSSFVLPQDQDVLVHAAAPMAQVAGAIHGSQKCVVVSSQVRGHSINVIATAILADISSLALPANIQGIVGLRFLRNFQRWGAEQTANGGWQFFLESS
jgi:predicted aspartyl protease